MPKTNKERHWPKIGVCGGLKEIVRGLPGWSRGQDSKLGSTPGRRGAKILQAAQPKLKKRKEKKEKKARSCCQRQSRCPGEIPQNLSLIISGELNAGAVWRATGLGQGPEETGSLTLIQRPGGVLRVSAEMHIQGRSLQGGGLSPD